MPIILQQLNNTVIQHSPTKPQNLILENSPAIHPVQLFLTPPYISVLNR